MEEHLHDASNLNPLALILLLVALYLTGTVPRRFAVCPLLVITFLLPLGQTLVLFGLHLQFFRLVLLTGLLRVMANGEAGTMQWVRMDKLFFCWVVASVTLGALSKPSMGLFTYRLGDAFNAAGCYFFVRCVVREFDDIVISIRTLAYVSMPVAAFMLVEKSTSHNLLSVLGGVPELSAIRDGHIRCQGAFRHPIVAGIVGAAQLPLFAALWSCCPHRRKLAVAGLGASMVIALTAASSGALIALVIVLCGLAFWNYRQHLCLIKWGTVLVIIVMALAMKAPVWYLLARVADVAGGGGWHRAYLIDQTIAHFDEWWLFGTTYTAHWGPGGEVIAADPNMMDITNQYVMEGVKGGVVRLALFAVIIRECFKGLGRALRVKSADSASLFLIWAVGVSVFAHCISFLSITYFDQSIIIWGWIQAVSCLIGQLNDSRLSARLEPNLAAAEDLSLDSN
jgi:hypothetical protein